MRVTLLQTDICWADPEANICEAERLLSQQEGSNLYVLPEMWSTGFMTEPAGLLQSEEGNAALQWMQQTARQKRCAICGSLAVRIPDGTFRNRHYFVDGIENRLYFYDKRHLFTYGHEYRHYTAGQTHTIVRYCGMRLLLLTCYDLRFPCWSRFATGREFDAIVIVANWPESRQSAWQLLTRARAIENQCFLIGVNRVGDDRHSHYAGASAVIDCNGKTLGQCRRNTVQALTVEIDYAELQRRRMKFRVLDDRD